MRVAVVSPNKPEPATLSVLKTRPPQQCSTRRLTPVSRATPRRPSKAATPTQQHSPEGHRGVDAASRELGTPGGARGATFDTHAGTLPTRKARRERQSSPRIDQHSATDVATTTTVCQRVAVARPLLAATVTATRRSTSLQHHTAPSQPPIHGHYACHSTALSRTQPYGIHSHRGHNEASATHASNPEPAGHDQ